MAALPTEHSWCALEFFITALWQFNGHSNGNLDAVVLQCRQSEDMNNLETEARSVIKGKVMQEDQALLKRQLRKCMKVLFRAPGNLSKSQSKAAGTRVHGEDNSKETQVYLYRLQVI
jgi:hypothetical protein